MIKYRHANIPFFMKQMSGNSKKTLQAIPEYLNIQEFPVGSKNNV